MAKIYKVEEAIWIQPNIFHRFPPILVLNISFVDLTPAGLDKIFTGCGGLDKPAWLFPRYEIKRDSERGLVEVTVVGLDTDNIGLLPMSGPCLPFHLSTKAKTKINAARETNKDKDKQKPIFLDSLLYWPVSLICQLFEGGCELLKREFLGNWPFYGREWGWAKFLSRDPIKTQNREAEAAAKMDERGTHLSQNSAKKHNLGKFYLRWRISACSFC